MLRKRSLWSAFVLLSLIAGGLLGLRFYRGERQFLVPGQMTRGHFPIETECDRCHTPMLGVKTEACLDCHAEELERVDDSHPPSKFTDPRNADRLAALDARNCVICHVEHRPELTHALGVTQPRDVCRLCHQDIAEDRPSHAGLSFATCQDAGCHNYHDNRSLTEDYLASQFGKPTGAVPVQTHKKSTRTPLTAAKADASGSARIIAEWAGTVHARASVNCTGCHGDKPSVLRPHEMDRPHAVALLEKGAANPLSTHTSTARGAGSDTTANASHTSGALDSCRECHERETEGFFGGKHGMREHVGLSPMRPSMARLPMREDAQDRELGCTTCHSAHAFDRKQAAVDACLGCHADKHSLAYRDTKHYQLWQREQRGELAAGSGVSCATCHLPRVPDVAGGMARVQHNQNDFLRPNEKLIDGVCRHCHSVEFAIDALADPEVIARGVDGRSTHHVRSVDMVRARMQRDNIHTNIQEGPR